MPLEYLVAEIEERRGWEPGRFLGLRKDQQIDLLAYYRVKAERSESAAHQASTGRSVQSPRRR